ncbi:hypothetical protein uvFWCGRAMDCOMC455_030 [Freshwater phage uvFW-CGR-AMD-COM-C455]|nr:hypothetical protein uvFWCGRAMDCOMC455_030 [Freshwater phage uvFW-CGR-AMD-COM-C455]
MGYVLIPPTIEEGPIGGHRLFYFYKMLRSISVLKIDGQYVEIREPSQDEIALATEVYIGGHEYPVSDAIAANLIAAGYQVITV